MAPALNKQSSKKMEIAIRSHFPSKQLISRNHKLFDIGPVLSQTMK